MSSSDPSPLPIPQLWRDLDLAPLLSLQACGDSRYASLWSDSNVNRRLFGGQLLGQAMSAATRSVPPGLRANSLQASFLRGGSTDLPCVYQVEALSDGRRYSTRQVRVLQSGRAVLEAHVSFHSAADAPGRQIDADPDVADPQELPDMVDVLLRHDPGFDASRMPLLSRSCVEMRAQDPERWLFGVSAEPRVQFWIKLRQPLPDDPAIHEAALAYLSDYYVTLAAYSTRCPLTQLYRQYIASLNHGLWIHRTTRADGWLLFDSMSPASSEDRGLALTRVYDCERRLVASVSQQYAVSERI